MNLFAALDRCRDYVLPVSIVACVGVILVPMPAAVMDVLLLANITIALVVLLTTINIRTPLEFSVFPTLLVATTLGRLVLNIATTRLILTRAGSESENAAGGMIRAFGDFVAGDVLLVGIVIFAIIVLIQFLVITKGATRVSEVAARFALDGMPGKQMAVDADLNAGAITDEQAKAKREDIARQADFYASMDGATKFVRGDAIAGIAITAINICVGLYMGVALSGMSFSRAFEVFTKLTIGDGLVSQIPAFLIAIATALLVTRSTQSENLPSKFVGQLLARPESLLIAAGFLALLIFTGLPTIPLMVLTAICTGLSLIILREKRAETKKDQQESKPIVKPQAKPEDHLAVDAVRVEIGVGLLSIADPGRGGDLMDCITSVRSKLAAEMGYLLPKVRLKDNLSLPQNSYQLLIGGNVVDVGDVQPAGWLAVETSNCELGFLDSLRDAPLPPSRCAAYEDRWAAWITEDQREDAIASGYELRTPSETISAHVEQAARDHAPELLTRDATQHLVNQLQQKSPTVVNELIPSQLKLAQVQGVLKRLLAEDIPIVQLEIIFEALGDHSIRVQDPSVLTEKVRTRLSRTISQRFSSNQNELNVFTLDSHYEEQFCALLEETHGIATDLTRNQLEVSTDADLLIRSLKDQLIAWQGSQRCPVLLVRPRLRSLMHALLKHQLPNLRVLSHAEITLQTRVVSKVLMPTPLAA